MTWARWVRVIGLIMLGIWATYVIVVIAAFAGVEAAERTEPGHVVVTPVPMPGPTWHPPR